MISCGQANFAGAFAALHNGHTPFLWQSRLYERFLANDIPAVCTLPTGLGKTSVITLWLLLAAPAGQVRAQPNQVPEWRSPWLT